jgi:hypothetical protein
MVGVGVTMGATWLIRPKGVGPNLGESTFELINPTGAARGYWTEGF